MPDISITDLVAHPLARYRNHLEFHGYHIEEDDNVILCRHSSKTNLMLKAVSDRGVLISTIYSCKSNIKRINLLEYMNTLNYEFVFMKAYVNEENALMMETFLEGIYDRTNFSLLLDNIEHDMGTFGGNEFTEQYLE